MTQDMYALLADIALSILAAPDARAATDELHRELEVRRRCYPRWVKDGKMSQTEANDRLVRLTRAHEMLELALAALDSVAEDGTKVRDAVASLVPSNVTNTGDKEKAGQPGQHPF